MKNHCSDHIAFDIDGESTSNAHHEPSLFELSSLQGVATVYQQPESMFHDPVVVPLEGIVLVDIWSMPDEIMGPSIVTITDGEDTSGNGGITHFNPR